MTDGLRLDDDDARVGGQEVQIVSGPESGEARSDDDHVSVIVRFRRPG